jgi:hypothetical protein
MRGVTLLLLVLLSLCAACSGPRKAPDTETLAAAASAKLQSIPAADPQKYRALKGMKNWRNPYLTVSGDSIALLDPEDSEQRPLKPDEVLTTLAALPASAWPYGRVVALAEEASSGGEEQRIAVRRNKGIVAGTLEGAHIEIVSVPAS